MLTFSLYSSCSCENNKCFVLNNGCDMDEQLAHAQGMFSLFATKNPQAKRALKKVTDFMILVKLYTLTC